MKRALGPVGGAALLGACGCTLVGCLSSVEVSLASLIEWSGTESFTVALLCMDDYCDSQNIDPERADVLRSNNRNQVSFDLIPNDLDTVVVSIVVSTDSGTMQNESSDIDFESHRPNGAFCEPECFFASVMIENGRLVDQ